MLKKCIAAIESGETQTTLWHLQTIPTVRFYQLLHQFLKKWTITRYRTKNFIGIFYIAIDDNFAGKRPDNVFRHVDLLSKAGKDFHDGLMSYPTKQAGLLDHTDSPGIVASHLSDEICELRDKLEISKNKLHSTNLALRDVTNEKLQFKKERDSAMIKAAKYQKSTASALQDLQYLVDELEFENNHNKLLSLSENDIEFSPDSDTVTFKNSQDEDLLTATKSGKAYSNSVRKLYYTLLSGGVPVSKIDSLIKDVVKWSNPSVDTSKLKLPKKSCASYMRKDELKVVSNAHKSTSLCDQIASGAGLRLNTDGTTKNQKKIGCVAMNAMTISVNELVDGSASTAISDVSRELEKLRKTASALGFKNADAINWSMVESSTSDSASTQKCFNRLLLEERNKESVSGCAAHDEMQFIETFCSMHLSINLRKAFMSGVNTSSAEFGSWEIIL